MSDPAGAAPTRVAMRLESRFESIDIAERALIELLRGIPIDEEMEFALTTALREAMANAVRHGGRGLPGDAVVIELAVDDKTLSLCVRDRGDGFDLAAVPDPTAPENLLKPCGRGIFTMRQFMDSVVFRRPDGGGTMVEMRRKITTRDKGESS